MNQEPKEVAGIVNQYANNQPYYEQGIMRCPQAQGYGNGSVPYNPGSYYYGGMYGYAPYNSPPTMNQPVMPCDLPQNYQYDLSVKYLQGTEAGDGKKGLYDPGLHYAVCG